MSAIRMAESSRIRRAMVVIKHIVALASLPLHKPTPAISSLSAKMASQNEELDQLGVLSADASVPPLLRPKKSRPPRWLSLPSGLVKLPLPLK